MDPILQPIDWEERYYEARDLLERFFESEPASDEELELLDAIEAWLFINPGRHPEAITEVETILSLQ